MHHSGRSALGHAGISLALALLIACHKGDFEPIRRPQPQPSAEPSLGNRYQLGQKVSFRAGGNSESFRVSGWSVTEQDHTWTDGSVAILKFSGIPIGLPLRLDADVSGAVRSPSNLRQVAEVYANGKPIARWEVAASMEHVTAEVPALSEASGDALTIEFRILDPVSPASVGLGSDTRHLGLSFIELSISST